MPAPRLSRTQLSETALVSRQLSADWVEEFKVQDGWLQRQPNRCLQGNGRIRLDCHGVRRTYPRIARLERGLRRQINAGQAVGPLNITRRSGGGAGTFNTQSRALYDSYLAGASAVDWIICTGPRSPDGTSFESAL
jgi:hypothetical protein